MADLTPATSSLLTPKTRDQLGAIANIRWSIFKNSLRTMRGRMELVSWIFIAIWFAILGVGGSLSLALGTWFVISHGRTEWLAALFWPIFAYWIFFPVVAAAFTETFDSANLLRYPLRYRTFFLVNLIYGSLDVSTVVGTMWLFGALAGAAVAAPVYAPWSLLVILTFGAANLLLIRAIFAWIDRWLAQRRTREIMGILFFVTMISFQMVGPMMARFGGHRVQLPVYLTQAVTVQKFLPAGLAAEAMGRAFGGEWLLAFGALLLLAAYASLFLFLLNARMRAQYAGENLGEAAPREQKPAAGTVPLSGWSLPGISGPVAAMVEKETRYLLRSGQTLFTLFMPAVILVIFRMSTNPARPHGGGFGPALAFPFGVGYMLLLLSNLLYNNFANDSAGIQFYFLAPVRMQDVLLAKNIVHGGVLVLEVALIWIATRILYQPPDRALIAVTIAALLCAAPLDFSVGNILSIYSPKKHDFGKIGRQRASGTTVLVSMGVLIVIAGVVAATILLSHFLGGLWVATAMFVGLSAVSFIVYRILLGRANQFALRRREELIAEIAKAG
jgi:ABC-2 type transport system permease protein